MSQHERKSRVSRVQDDVAEDLDYWRSNIDGAQMSGKSADEEEDEDDVSKTKKRLKKVFGTVGGGSYSSVRSTQLGSFLFFATSF